MREYDDLDSSGSGPLGQALVDGLEFFLRSLPLMLVVGALGAAGGAYRGYTSAPVFRAQTKLFVDDPVNLSMPMPLIELTETRKSAMNRRLEVLRSIQI